MITLFEKFSDPTRTLVDLYFHIFILYFKFPES